MVVVLGARLGFNSTFHSHDYVGAERDCLWILKVCCGPLLPRRDVAQGDARLTAEALTGLQPVPLASWRAAFRADMASLAAERADEAALETLPMHPRRALAEIRGPCPKTPS